jgi:hypothetical protein
MNTKADFEGVVYGWTGILYNAGGCFCGHKFFNVKDRS